MTFSSFAWSGTNAADYSQTNTCPVSPSTLAVSGTCTVTVSFKPTAAGARTATMTVNSDASNTPALAISMTGTATTAATPSITSNVTSLNFSATTINTSATAQAITVTNNGQAALAISAVSLGGTNPTEFSQTNNCPASLAVNASCTVTVGFKPTTVGSKSASLTVASNASNAASYNIGLTGNAVAAPVPSITSNVTTLTFPSTTINTSAATQTVTITNNATPNAAGQSAALSISSISLSGGNAGDFSQTNNCPASLAAAASCTVTVGFKPLAVGASAASLTIASNASNAPSYVVGLSGTGAAVPMPAVTLDMTTMDFGNQLLNTASANQTITVTNSGNANLSIATVTSNSAMFKVANNGCIAAVAPAGTCTIDVNFTPTATGTQSGKLTISATGISDSVVNLSGSGVASNTSGADAINGQKLYTANCAGCHSAAPSMSDPLRVHKGASAQVTKTAINANMGGMGSLSSLTTQNLNDIAAYIAAQTAQSPTLMTGTGGTGGTSTNVGGGGCTVGTTDSPFDPLLLLMAGISLFVLVRRQSKR